MQDRISKRDIQAVKAKRRMAKLARKQLRRHGQKIQTASLNIGSAESRDMPGQTSATSPSDGRQ